MLALVNYVGLSMYCNIDLPGLIEGFAFLLLSNVIFKPGICKMPALIRILGRHFSTFSF